MANVNLVPLPPAEAIKYFRKKTVGGRFSFAWADVWQEEHAASFVVAKAMRADILKIIFAGLDRALAEGRTARQFANEVRPLLQSKGWWGKKRQFDPVVKKTKLVQLGSARRLQFIYDTNLRTARAAGRWEIIERLKKRRPFLRYVAVLDERTRALHRRWHGITLPVDHNFWKTHYPPNGWNCRCIVMQLSQRDIDKGKGKLTANGDLAIRGFGQTRPWKNPRTGKVSQVPLGIDPGWGSNVGQARGDILSRFLAGKLDGLHEDMATAAVADLVRGPVFARHVLGLLPGFLPIGSMTDQMRDALGVSTRLVRFSQATAQKQLRRHPDIGAAQYAKVQKNIASAIILHEGTQNLVMFFEDDGRWWRAVIKVTADLSELYLTTFHRVAAAQVTRAIASGTVIGSK